MKKELTELLMCPVCKEQDLSIRNAKTSRFEEILEGYLFCGSCGREYPIKSGILDLLLNKELQAEYDPDSRRERNSEKEGYLNFGLTKKDIANRKNLDQKWVSNSTTDFNQVFNSLRLTGSEVILEIGAGTCWAIQQFARIGCKCIAMDLIEYNKLEVGDYWFDNKNLYFERLLADMNATNFRDNTFDIVYYLSTLMYSTDIPNTLHEIARILKPGGKMMLIDEPIIPFYRKGGKDAKIGSGRACTIFQWHKYLKAVGFKVVRRYFAESIKMRFRNPEMIMKKNKWYYYAAKVLNPFANIVPRWFNMDAIALSWSILMPLPLIIIAMNRKV